MIYSVRYPAERVEARKRYRSRAGLRFTAEPRLVSDVPTGDPKVTAVGRIRLGNIVADMGLLAERVDDDKPKASSRRKRKKAS